MISLKDKDSLDLLEAANYLVDLLEGKGFNEETFLKERERLKEVFTVILHQLRYLFEKERERLHGRSVQEGIHALMHLVSEATEWVGRGTNFSEDLAIEKITEVKEYKELQDFYLHKIASHLSTDRSSEEWQVISEEDFSGHKKELLDQIEVIRQDTDYELLFIRSAEGRPFFTKHLLHQLKLLGDFEGIFHGKEQEEFFQKTFFLEDKELQIAAKTALDEITPYIDEYYQEALKKKPNEGTSHLNKTMMALMLAGNVRNRAGNALGKTCLSYYRDFLYYLKKVFLSQEYLGFSALSPEKVTPFIHAFLSICQVFTRSLWMRTSPVKDFTVLLEGFAPSTIESKASLTQKILHQDEKIRSVLNKYPSGPLMHAVSLFRMHQQLSGFNPLTLGNLPSHLYTISGDNLHVSVLRIASPTSQEYINHAEVTIEFKNFIREVKGGHLLINLQESTSWKEHARSKALEDFSKDNLLVVTLPKSGDFYIQRGEYENLSDASLFMRTFYKQISGGKECGYFFPASFKLEQWQERIHQIMDFIHKDFFHKKESLTHGERLDFVEIFFLFFSLRLIEFYKVDSCSFTCKDGIDAGSLMSCELYLLLKGFKDKEADVVCKLLFEPCLTRRHRSLLQEPFNRMISALTLLESKGGAPLITGLKVS